MEPKRSTGFDQIYGLRCSEIVAKIARFLKLTATRIGLDFEFRQHKQDLIMGKLCKINISASLRLISDLICLKMVCKMARFSKLTTSKIDLVLDFTQQKQCLIMNRSTKINENSNSCSIQVRIACKFVVQGALILGPTPG